MAEQPDNSNRSPGGVSRLLWGLFYFFILYFLSFAFLMIDGWVFHGNLFFNSIQRHFPNHADEIVRKLETVYYPLIKTLEAMHFF